ncbi:MAG: UMP kinase [Candidatus Marinimicrobia bacterium]|nr:UMP kinase [Candidatus Neomarinimicrobiota bacterium]
MKKKPYKRILLKLSGEILAGNRGYGIDPDVLSQICNKIIKIKEAGIEIGIVIGGGNIFRGISAAAKGMDRVAGDYLGMMATIMNSVGLQSGLEELNCDTRVMSALSITQLAEPYIRRRATRHLEKNRIVIMAGGTGNPYFTTDTAAVLRAIEIDADVVIKATKVDGIYSEDPVANPDAIKYPKITFKEVIDRELKVMDMTAVTLCKENKLPIIVFNINEDENIVNLIDNKHIGTLVS